MKIAFALVLISGLSLTLTACGGGGDSKDGGPAAGTVVKKNAVHPNGTCTQDVLDDLKTLTELMQREMQGMMADLRDGVSKKTDPAETERLTRARNKTMSDAIDKLQETYGEFKCTAYANGQSTVIDSTEIYEAGKKMKMSPKDVAPAPQKVGPTGADGECPAEFSADYRVMGQQVRVPMAEMLDATSQIMGNLRGDQSANVARIKRAGRQALSIFEGFRAKYPGEYVCNVALENGTKTVVSSQDMDEHIGKIRAQVGY